MPTVESWKQRAHRDSYLNAEAIFSFYLYTIEQVALMDCECNLIC
jgi:hypothetical protein